MKFCLELLVMTCLNTAFSFGIADLHEVLSVEPDSNFSSNNEKYGGLSSTFYLFHLIEFEIKFMV